LSQTRPNPGAPAVNRGLPLGASRAAMIAVTGDSLY
jgi:hypothetical protein